MRAICCKLSEDLRRFRCAGPAFVRIDEEDTDWQWVQRLFDEVSRQVTGSDRVLEEIETALRSGEEIGINYEL